MSNIIAELFDNLYPDPEFDEGFTHRVSTVPLAGNTPGANGDEKLRLIMWLNEQGLENGQDYQTASFYARGTGSFYRVYAFKDANKAMLFKLTWL